MLTAANLAAFVATTDVERSRTFYEKILGLRLVEQTPGRLVFDARGAPLRVSLVPKLDPGEHTVLGWQVADAGRTARDLASRGVAFDRFEDLDQNELGIWTAPDGAHVAWFRDPDGNVLSITEA